MFLTTLAMAGGYPIDCSHKIQQIGADYYSQAVFNIGKSVVVDALGEFEDGSHWIPAKAELQDKNGNWHARMGNINVYVKDGKYGSNQNWIPQKIGNDPEEFIGVFGAIFSLTPPEIRCSLTN